MELRHLTLFVAAAEELNFTRAAARVFTTQSSLSRAIQDLERELDVQLFDRSTSPLTLTPAGSILLTEAPGLLGHMQRVADRVATADRPAHGTLVVGCVADLPLRLLPEAIGRFRQELPDVTVRLQMMSASELRRAVADGAVDLGFSWGGAGMGEAAGEFEIGLMMPVGHPLTRPLALSPQAVGPESLIVMADGDGQPLHERLAALWSRRAGQPTVVDGVDRWEDGQRLVSAGLGAMLVPRHSARTLDQTGVVVRSFSPPLMATVWLCWEPSRRDQRAETFRSAVRGTVMRRPSTAPSRRAGNQTDDGRARLSLP